MQYIILAAIAGLIIILILNEVGNRRYKRNRLIKINNTFGTVRKKTEELTERMSQIAVLYDEEKKHIPETKLVDDITWNDLNMDDVFAGVNHTESFAGEQYLYSRLHILSGNEKHFEKFEKLADVFENDRELRNKVRLSLANLGKMTGSYYIPQMINDLDNQKIAFSFIPYMLPIALVITGIAALISGSGNLLFVFIILFSLNLTANIILKMKYALKVHSLFTMAAVISTASEINELMNEKNEKIDNTVKKMKKILRYASVLEYTSRTEDKDNPVSLIFGYIGGALMIDYICYDLLLREMKKHKDYYMDIYDYVAETDFTIGVVSFRHSLEKCCIPLISHERELKLTNCVHPAISNAVPNDFDFSSHVILTGSNASGKSTFIKTAALNIILAQTVHTCSAENAVIPECGVMTSMALRDDIISGDSYYIKEIKYLKRMTEAVNEKRLMFFAVDEILKGTNTRERIAASRAVLNYFADRNCILMVATHDTELAYKFDSIFENYYFTESISDGDISFDYKLHKGISTTTNALRLLEIIGFPDEILKNASCEC